MKKSKKDFSKVTEKEKEIKRLAPKVLKKIFPAKTVSWGMSARSLTAQGKERLIPDRPMSQKEFFDVEHLCYLVKQETSVILLISHPITEQDIIDHFSQQPLHKEICYDSNRETRETRETGELCFNPIDESGHVNSFCAWAVTPNDKEEIRGKLIPRLNDLGIEYIIQYVQQMLRVWLFCDTSISMLRAFINQMINDARIKLSSDWSYLVPTHAQDHVPIPGGFDLNHNCVNPVEFKGNISCDAIFIMNAIIKCRPVSEEVMKMLITTSKEA